MEPDPEPSGYIVPIESNSWEPEMEPNPFITDEPLFDHWNPFQPEPEPL